MKIEVINSNFWIRKENVKAALDAIVDKLRIPDPKIKSAPYALQAAMTMLGWHTRVHDTGVIFGLRWIGNQKITIEPKVLFSIIGPFTEPGNQVTIKIEGKKETFVLNKKKDESESLLAYMRTVQREAYKTNYEETKKEDDIFLQAAKDLSKVKPNTFVAYEETESGIISNIIEPPEDILQGIVDDMDTGMPEETPVETPIETPSKEKVTMKGISIEKSKEELKNKKAEIQAKKSTRKPRAKKEKSTASNNN